MRNILPGSATRVRALAFGILLLSQLGMVSQSPSALANTADPGIAVSTSSLAEGDAGTSSIDAITVTLDSIADQAVTIVIQLTGGTAVVDHDYRTLGAQVVIPVGSLSATLKVDVIGNLDLDGDRTILVDATTDFGHFAGTASQTQSGLRVTITDNESAPSGARVRGQVFDGDPSGGYSLAGISVRAIDSATGSTVASVISLSDGNYLLDVDPGSYIIQFVSENGGFVSQFWDHASASGSATVVSLAQDEIRSGITAALAPNGVGQISGKVVDAGGNQVQAGVSAIFVTDPSKSFVTTTRPDGTYTLAVLEGNYWVAATAPPRLPVYYPNVPSRDSSGPFFVRVGASLTGIDLQFPVDTASVTGRITVAGTNLAAGGACAQVFDAATGSPGPAGCADASGTFTISGITPGDWHVSFSAPNYVTEWLGGSTDQATSTIITLHAGQQLSGVDGHVRLSAFGVLAGTVTTSASGAPIGNVCIRLFRQSTFAFGGSGCTDSTGQYTISGIAPATDYLVEFRLDGYRTVWYPNADSSGNGALSVVVTAGTATTGIDAVLTRAASISGRVIDETGAPADGACVTASDATNGATVLHALCTGTDGVYRLDGLAAGAYILQSIGPNLTPVWYPNARLLTAATPITVVAGQSITNADITSPRTGTIRGRVIDVNLRTPIPGVHVRAFSDTWGEVNHAASTQTDGSFELDGVPPGDWRLLFDARFLPTYLDEWYDDVLIQAEARPITVPSTGVVSGVEGRLATSYYGSISLMPQDDVTGQNLTGACYAVYDTGTLNLLLSGCSHDEFGLTTGLRFNLAKGSFKILVRQPASSAIAYSDAWVGGGSTLSDATSTALEYGQNLDLGTLRLRRSTPPDTTITAPADGSVLRGPSVAPSFTANPATGATFECSVDSAVYASCVNATALTGLSDGSHTFAVRASSSAGTDPTPASVTFTTDSAGPVVTSSPVDPTSGAVLTANADGWFRTAVSVKWSCSDAPAGVDSASCPPASLVGTDGAQLVSVMASDRVGNPTSTSVTIKLDATPPTILGSIIDPVTGQPAIANADGSYPHPVNVHWSCSDATSGVRTDPVRGCPPDISVSADGTTSVSGTVEDVAGNSAVATVSVRILSMTVPGAPTAVAGAAADQSIVLSFTPPTATGGSPLTGFIGQCATSSGASGQGTSPASPLTVSGLTNGLTYQCTVTASNNVGAGPPSAAVTVVLPLRVPTAPTNLTATTSNTSVALSWTASTSNGTPVTGYIATCNAGTTTRTGTSTTTSATITNLASGTTYTCSVVATNVAGRSVASNQVAVIPKALPGAPVLSSVSPSDQAISLAFSPPTSNAGGITSYTGRCLTTGQAAVFVVGSASPVVVSHLTNGLVYECTVIATNAVGDGPPSGSRSATPRTVPGAPILVSATAGNTNAALTWTGPTSDGGSAILGYSAVCVGPATRTATAAATATSVVVTGLVNGASYSCTVAARNVAGTGPASNAFATTSATVPRAPSSIVASGGDRSVNLTFAAPTNDGGSPITAYVASCSAPGQQSGTATAPTSPLAVPGLTNGIDYACAVAAVNAVGQGSAVTRTATPRTVPDPPVGLAATAGDRQITLRWAAGASNGGAPISGYTATCSSGGTVTAKQASAPATSVAVTGLTNGLVYNCTVTAHNVAGISPTSTSVSITPRTVPGAPTLSAIVAESKAATLIFALSPNNGGAVVTSVTATCQSSATGAITPVTTSGTQSPLTVSGLSPSIQYRCSVVAANEAGNSAKSASLSVVPKA
jgi:Fibronectin type III domain/Carboxypeptidase regulatory-like domain